jgi:uncharacterized protein YfbU (UPF0304 family)
MASGTITLRIDEDKRSELEALARGRGETISDVIRTAIDDVVLGRDADRSPLKTGPPTLTLFERSLLAAQHRLMAATLNAEDYEIEDLLKLAEILENGFSGEYDAVFRNLDSELSRAECRQLWDILDMFRMLESSFKRLDEAQKKELGEHAEYALSFHGFDFNDSLEAKLARYTKFLIGQERWVEQAEVLEHDGGNSHRPMLETYRRMLLVFSDIWSARTSDYSRGLDSLFLELKDLKAVYEAWPNPRG